jgi:hypothetical protein
MKTIIYKTIQFLIGENAQDNFNILDDSLKINSNFLWFHLNSFPSCFVIMHATVDDIKHDKDEFLYFAANLCKINSKYKNFQDLKICYTTLKKLKKSEKIGEIIITGKRNIIKL